MSGVLKFSAILILSHLVLQSEQYQPCLNTMKHRDNDYTFALAQVDDYRNPLGPQEACYYSCGAQIVTQSSNTGDLSQLTLMDTAATHLTSTGFLKVGESYFLNHLGMSAVEGGNGIGCIEIKPANKIVHHPKDHVICSMAKTAVCGFWGQQSIPPSPPPKKDKKPAPVKTLPKPTRKPKPKPKKESATTLVKPVTEPKPNTMPAPIPPVVLPSPTSAKPVLVPTTSIDTLPKDVPAALPSSEADAVPNAPVDSVKTVSMVMTVTVVVPNVEQSAPPSIPRQPITQPIEQNPVSPVLAVPDINPSVESRPTSDKFTVDGRSFHVIGKYEKSLASADLTCNQNRASVASISSASFPMIQSKLKGMNHAKLIIGAWNGDGYSLTGENCLILQTDHGIFPGSCADASAVLCQS